MNRLCLLASLFVVLFFVGSCSCNPLNRECPDGQWNFNGLCVPGCLTNEDCAPDEICSLDEDDLAIEGVCINKTDQ